MFAAKMGHASVVEALLQWNTQVDLQDIVSIT